MSEIEVRIPLDSEQFLRRECPHCVREFKIQLSADEIVSLATKGVQSYLVDETDTDNSDDDYLKYYCPYCGQEAPVTHWWTQEQLSYFQVYAQNIAARMVNEQLIEPMKKDLRPSSGPVSISFTGSEIKMETPWISDEVDDMTEFDLQCCKRKVKLIDDWDSIVHCFSCGFGHNANIGV
jgi:hypothetical protein